MKVIILAGVAPSTIFTHAPLATALRNAGHQVMVTSSIEEMIPVITGVGLPAVPVTDPETTPQQILAKAGLARVPEDPVEREGLSGRWYARIETEPLDALLAFAAEWGPDVVVGGMSVYSAPLLAARLGVPYVRHAWDIHHGRLADPEASDELREELAELGLDGLPEPDMMIDVTPPSLRTPEAGPAQMMRWVPANAQSRLEPWMYTRGEGRRICVTIGTGVATYNQHDFLQGIVENISAVDAEVVVPVSDDAAPALRERMPDVKAGWIPLDVVAPTCDVIVHQTGGSTMLTALTFGVPQILIPDPGQHRACDMARRLAEAGAAVVLSPEEATSEVIAKKCQQILSDPAYAEAAAGLGREMAALPLPSEVVRRIERLVGRTS
ncbi:MULTISPECIES: glycosyltransferase [Actinomadura]|uniref:glycosyltransferase n=1 Tax=Actinomadura TaxID=1988 RepID=UPI000400679A|nr:MULTISPECIES: glycosyltransferase [Actinomadura]RSN55632.1 dNTP-hexose glycosyl transferase [Actinomadura sp. WAC 06369]